MTCSPPPFNLAISNSAKTAKKLTFVGQVGPMDPGSLNLGSQGNEDVVFIPEKDGLGGITIQSGFVYSMDPSSGQQVSFISNNVRYGSPMPLGPLSTDPYPNNVLQSVKSIHNVIIFQFNDAAPINNAYSIVTGNPGTSSFTPSSQASLPTVVQAAFGGGLNKEVIGLSIYPDPSTALDRTYWLYRRQGTNNFHEALFDISQGPISGGSYLRGAGTYDVSPFVGDFTVTGRVLYYYDPNSNRSYVSLWNSLMSPGNWSTWVWIDNVPTYSQLTGIDNRIDDLLTTGELLSTQGNTATVYDPTTPTGTFEASFPLGDLRFIGEVYIGGTATVLFSEALWFGNQVTFNVYSIPTSQLKTLAQ